MNLYKNYRLVWNNANEVTLLNKFPTTSVTGCGLGFDADSKAEVDAKITELSLTLSDELADEWEKIE